MTLASTIIVGLPVLLSMTRIVPALSHQHFPGNGTGVTSQGKLAPGAAARIPLVKLERPQVLLGA